MLAARRYGNDPSASLRGVEALLVADTEPRRAQALIDAVKTRNAANPHIMRPTSWPARWRGWGGRREAVEWLREAAATGFPCYALFARDPALDRIRADPGMKAFMAEMASKAAAFRQ